MATTAPQQLIYFISGMWCSTCAKNIHESVSQIDGVSSADLNYSSKLLLVRSPQSDASHLDQVIQNQVRKIGFGIKKQSSGWVSNFHETLQKESNLKLPWTQVSLVWFLAMWSSMLAFSSYIGGTLSSNELYLLALASSAFGLPAILLGIIPYANAGIRALRYSHLLTLDLFIFVGGCSAILISIHSLLNHSHITYADSGSMIIAILLLTKKIENSITSKITSNILFQIHPKRKQVEVLKNGAWVPADVTQIRKGNHVRVAAEELIPFDGILESPIADLNNHLMNGESKSMSFKKGDHLIAGAIAQSPLELIVTASQGERKIDEWAEIALLAGNNKSQYSKLFSKIESSLVVVAFLGAVVIASVQLLSGAGYPKAVESFFVGILIFCPCLFASILPLTKQMVHLTLLRSGLLLSRSDALLDLSKVKNFYFDKTGTLEAVESTFIPTDPNDMSSIGYLNTLARQSKHITLRGLPVYGEERPIHNLNEVPGRGLTAIAEDGTEIIIGMPAYLEERGLSTLKENSVDSLVAINQKIVGQIVRKSIYDSESINFLRKLMTLVPSSKIDILSGDPALGAGKLFSQMSERITYRGGLTPENKADLIQGASVFVGDGLNDTLALAKANVSFRIGYRVDGFAPVDFHLQIPNLNLILTAVQYSKKYRKVLIQTVCAAFLYNAAALTLAAFGKFSPLGAVLSMLLSFSIMLLSVSRLSRIQGTM